MSSSSSTMRSSGRLLHQVEHAGERRLQLQRLLDLVGTHIRVFPVFKEARTVVLANELDERLRVRLPVLGEPLKVGEDGGEAAFGEQGHGILGVLVEVGVEDALI